MSKFSFKIVLERAILLLVDMTADPEVKLSCDILLFLWNDCVTSLKFALYTNVFVGTGWCLLNLVLSK